MIEANFVNTVGETIRRNWGDPALSDYKGVTYSFGQVAEHIYKLHRLFEAAGIAPGDKITLIGKNQASWGIAYLATTSYGAVIVPLLVDFKPRDVENLINHSDSVALFVCGAVLRQLDMSACPAVHTVVSLDNLEVVQSAQNLSTAALPDDFGPKHFTLPKVSNNTLLGILYTSGTSGFSKGVMLNHDSIMSNIEFAQRNMPLKSGDKIVSFLPMAHAYGCAFEFLFPFSLGCHITILGKVPSPQVILKAFGEVRPRLILMVPLVLEKVYKSKLAPVLDKPVVKVIRKIPLLKNLIYNKMRKGLEDAFGGNFFEVVIGGAALNPEVENFLRTINFPYTVGYGMTECGPLISYVNADKTRFASSGKSVHTLEVRIEKSEPDASDGEIMVRGNNVMLGYYKNPEATAEVLTDDGWLHTGDLGHIDADGYIYIRGRSKSLILGPSGKNIYPEEIEARFNNLPCVMESLAVQRDMKNVILLYLDPDRVKGLGTHEVDQLVRDGIRRVNADMPSYYAVKDYEIRSEEFEKTAKRSIKRFLYK